MDTELASLLKEQVLNVLKDAPVIKDITCANYSIDTSNPCYVCKIYFLDMSALAARYVQKELVKAWDRDSVYVHDTYKVTEFQVTCTKRKILANL
jgi:hypothetical protein